MLDHIFQEFLDVLENFDKYIDIDTSDLNLPIVVGQETAFDPWANEVTLEYETPPELLQMCKE